VVLRVTDNGSGFSQEAPKQKGMGLQIMKSRAGMIGGTLTIENAQSGAQVICSVAIKDRTEQNPNNRARKKENRPRQKVRPHR
jgi:nitrate/nitrite-specific signal transduction histidine kinase